MLIFAVVSELPYDMLFYGEASGFYAPNILFELAAGIAALWCIDTVMKKKLVSSHSSGGSACGGVAVL